MSLTPSASLFSLPLAPWQQPESIRSAQSGSRKRRRGSEPDEATETAGEETQEGESEPEILTKTVNSSSLILSPNEAHQYRIAGLSFDRELPGGNFPHAPAPDDDSQEKEQRSGNLEAQLASLKPPIYIPRSATYRGNLRLQHLATLTAILHRCLLEGDYVRAGRAFGLILREEFGGHAVDVRSQGRWGIGAEILLRQHSSIPLGSKTHDDSTGSKFLFTRKGFEDAKRYYERLIIQYPFRKASPEATSSLDFYPAMFGLWIYVTEGESRAAREIVENEDEASPDSQSEMDESNSPSDFAEKGDRIRAQKVIKIRSDELNEAQTIAARMDEILVSPPYSDRPDLLRLRGMVSLWISDLLVSASPYYGDNTYEHLSEGLDESLESMTAKRERASVSEKRDAELTKADRFFDDARSRREGVTRTLEDFHIDEDFKG